MKNLVFACALLMSAQAARAQGTVFKIAPIGVIGSDNFQAYALNDKGTIVGTLYKLKTGARAGVILDGENVTLLPSPDSAFDVPKPQAINNEGEILAWARNTGDGLVDMFLYSDGTYNDAYRTILEEPLSNNRTSPPNAFGFGDKKQVFFTRIVSFSDPTDGSYGVPPHFHQVPQFNRYNTIHSMNHKGVVAGMSYALGGSDVVFAGSHGQFVQLLPAGAIKSLGGYINDAGAVAGSYADASNVQHGFVYQTGAYTSFDMPESVSSITVTGINASGRVVGAYTNAAGRAQHAFLYNGTLASTFGTYSRFDTVSVSINNMGRMLVWQQKSSANAKFRSFVVTCKGDGC